jgi:hypothetical protein
MSLYRSEARLSESVGFFANKNLFQIGFVVLALSGLLRTAESLIDLGLHYNRHDWNLNGIQWLNYGLMNLANVVFAIVFLRYLSKKYNPALAWTALTLTVIGWIGYMAYISPFFMPNVPRIIPVIGNWSELFGRTGSPLSCILAPFMVGSKRSYHDYLLYVVNTDYAVKLLFLGFCIVKHPREAVRPVRSMAAHA